jgi:hypothetical protein
MRWARRRSVCPRLPRCSLPEEEIWCVTLIRPDLLAISVILCRICSCALAARAFRWYAPITAKQCPSGKRA